MKKAHRCELLFKSVSNYERSAIVIWPTSGTAYALADLQIGDNNLVTYFVISFIIRVLVSGSNIFQNSAGSRRVSKRIVYSST